MNRKTLLSALALGTVACTLARPAFAEGIITFHNGSSATPVLVEVRLGDTLDSAVPLASKKLAKNESWDVDTNGVLSWWRREVTPGAGDGKFTDWKRVNTLQSDEKIDV